MYEFDAPFANVQASSNLEATGWSQRNSREVFGLYKGGVSRLRSGGGRDVWPPFCLDELTFVAVDGQGVRQEENLQTSTDRWENVASEAVTEEFYEAVVLARYVPLYLRTVRHRTTEVFCMDCTAAGCSVGLWTRGSMTVERLEKLVEQPEFHRRLLEDFDRGYSLGIGRDPDAPSRFVLYLEVEGDNAPDVPSEIEVGDEVVRVITKTGFKVPTPYAARLGR